jgi:signal transduction histidine kinase
LTLVSAVLLVLLPTLAFLQYRWAGQVSVAEQDRMQRNLRNAAAQFRDAFDQEIGRAFGALQIGPVTARDGGSDQFSERVEAWRETAEFRDIVAGVYFVDAVDGALRLRRFDQGSHTLVEADWPPAIDRWQAEFAAQLDDFEAEVRGARRSLIPDDTSLLISPLRNFIGRPGAERPPTVPTFGFTVVALNRQAIVGTMLPALTQRFFPPTDDNAYRVAVVDASRPETVIYQSEPAAPVDPTAADTTLDFFRQRGPVFAFGRGFGRGDGVRGGGPPLPPGGNLAAGPPPRPGRWLLAVQHASGSLEAAVGIARRRNLAIGFGVLLLLAISVVLLARTSRQAHRLAQQQMEFVAGVSHELRTPIAVIRSAAENLSQGVVGNPERVKQYGAVMEGEARRLGEMVESVLQYAGVESGKGLGPLVPLQVVDVLDQAIESASRSADSPVEIERQIAADLPPVLGDQAALVSAVRNLVVNAVKHGGASGWVGIRVEMTNHGRRSNVAVTVSDRGPGIAADELPHIFEPFYRGSRALSEQIHGNGLGLSLVDRIARAHGGSVSVRSASSQGTSFTIFLPAAPADAAPIDAVAGDSHATVH